MANPHKGDVPFEVGGKVYTLCFSHLALVKAEKVLDKSVMKVVKEFEDPTNMRIGTIVALLWAGLQKHHPTMTMDDVAGLLDEADNGMASAIEVIGNGLKGVQRAWDEGHKPSAEGEWNWDFLWVEYISHGYDPDEFWIITPREMKLRLEAASKRFEREHNARVWLAWHIAAFQRMKKMPDIKRLFLNNTMRPRQTWRQQLQIMTEWANKRNAWLEQKAITDGR